MHYGAGNEDAAFERVVDLVADLPRNRGDEIVLRFDRLVAGVHHEEAARAVSVLHHAGFGAHLAEERGMLVSGDACERNLGGKHGGLGRPIHLRRGAHFRQHAARNIERFEQFVVPLQRVDVEERGARGVRHVGDVQDCPW